MYLLSNMAISGIYVRFLVGVGLFLGMSMAYVVP